MGRRRRNGRRIFLFPLPFQGHINPMLQLANILYSQGFSITVIHTTLNSPNPSQHPNFTFVPISDGFSGTDEESSPPNDLVSFLSLLNTRCVDHFRDCLARLLTDDDVSAGGDPAHCLISDAVLHFTRAVADSLNLPRIVLRTGGVCSFLVFNAFPLLLDKGYLPIQESSPLEEPVVEFPPLRVKDIPAIKTSNPEAVFELVNGMVQETKASSGLILNSFEELELPELTRLRMDFRIPIFLIGPFHKHFQEASSSGTTTSLLSEQDQSCISWLDKQPPRSVLYVSIGSIATMEEAEFLEIAFGLANSNQPFLWVVRPGSVHGSEWLESLPKELLEEGFNWGKIIKWAPQQQVLAHNAVGAFWTHCGWNSTLESICEGVPMICMPRFTDQLVNARYVIHVWRIGVELELANGGGPPGREDIERVISRVMREKEGEEMRERISHLKEKAQRCVMHGGSSYEYLNTLTNFISSL